MKVYKLIEEGDISLIENSLEKGDNYSHISVLTILDKLTSASLSKLRSMNAITLYEQLFNPSLLKDEQSALLIHAGIKILISAWKANTIYNEMLKQELDIEASRRLALFWKEAKNETYPSLNTITDFISRYMQQKTDKWLYNKLSADESEKLSQYAIIKLKELIGKPSNDRHITLLNSTFKVHFLYHAVLHFKNSSFCVDFSIEVEKKLKQSLCESRSSLLSEKIESLTFSGLIKDWRSNLISISVSEELEMHLISIFEKLEIPHNSNLKLTDITACSIVADFKKNRLDCYLSSYLKNLFKETLQIALFDDLLTDKTLQELSSITAEIILKWKKDMIELTMPYPIEKIFLPDLYQLKKKCKCILSSSQIVKRDGNHDPISREDIDQLKLVIANIPKMVETLFNQQFRTTTSLDIEDNSEKKEEQNSINFN